MLFLDQARWQAIWPGTAICSVFLAFNLFGDGAAQRA
jgi:ABC-type dipeptide/oligopeptide/nickel transport system permease subunit